MTKPPTASKTISVAERAAPTALGMRAQRGAARWRRWMYAYWMVLPALVLYCVFVVYPMARGV